MAEIAIAPTSQKQVWLKNAILQYSRESRLEPFMGPAPTITSTNDVSKKGMPIIQVIDDLKTENANVVNIPLVGKLAGQGVSGSMLLIGNEDDMPNFNAQVATDWLRNGVVVPKSVSYKTDLDLMKYGRLQLGTWGSERLRSNCITALGSVIIAGNPFYDPVTGVQTTGPDMAVPYPLATTAQKNAYLVNNSDRILFGNKVSNQVAGNWASSVAAISGTTDRATVAGANNAKRLFAKTTTSNTFPMRPYMVPDQGKEWVVAFMASNAFRDIAADTVMVNANRDARAREGNSMDRNPLFTDGDLEYNGVMYIWFPELDALTLIGAGASGVNVDMNFICGAQAIALAYSQMPRYISDNKYDYEFRPRVGYEECRGQKKLSYQGTMLGVLPWLTASIPDA